MSGMPVLTSAHDAVLAALDWLPDDIAADAAVVAQVLAIGETEAAQLLEDLAGC